MSRNIENRPEMFRANQVHNEISASDGRLIIISYEQCYGIYQLSDNRLAGFFAMPKGSHEGEIILARVSNIKKDIGAAFVKISDDTECFLKLTNIPEKLMPVKQGDLIPVKVIADEQKGKLISVSAKIPSKKLPDGWEHKSAFNVLYKPENSLKSFIENRINKEEYSKIVTDSEEVYNILNADDLSKADLYSDDKISLSSLYSLKTKLEEAVSPKVYLKSGGYLVINHTEALTVIDVNSGKLAPSKKADKEEIIHKLNLEAAKEAALQIKLRNISGMILIDFINTDSEDKENELIGAMNEYLASDNVKTKVIDITPLGIMEITRQKTDKPLSESLKYLDLT